MTLLTVPDARARLVAALGGDEQAASYVWGMKFIHGAGPPNARVMESDLVDLILEYPIDRARALVRELHVP